ncbi:MAG: hypothetical protein HQK70_08285, partial [Desulfamplus sp.]|nr:hypothetical protein [Desulfamplus sp.]
MIYRKLKQKRFRFFNTTHWFYMVLICLLQLPSVAISENRVDAERQNWEFFISGNSIMALLVADAGATLWVGTYGGGLEKRDAVTGELKNVYTKQNGLPDNNVQSILLDDNGGIWIGSVNYYDYEKSKGLAHMKSDGTWEVFNTENSQLPHNNVYSLLSDGQGGVWVGIYADPWSGTEGIAHLKAEGARFVFDTGISILPGYAVYSLLADGNGGIWAGTDRGLAHLKAEGTQLVLDKESSYLMSNSFLSTRSTRSYDQDSIWIDEDSKLHLKHCVWGIVRYGQELNRPKNVL